MTLASILCVTAQVESWTTPVPTGPQTEALIKRFAAMNPGEIGEYTQNIRKEIGDLTLLPQTIRIP